MEKKEWNSIRNIGIGSFVYIIPYDGNEENCEIVKVNSRTRKKIGYCDIGSTQEKYRYNKYIKAIPFDKEVRRNIGFVKARCTRYGIDEGYLDALYLEDGAIYYGYDTNYVDIERNGKSVVIPIEYIQTVHDFQNLLDLAKIDFKFDLRKK